MAGYDIFLIAHAALGLFLLIELGLVAALVDSWDNWYWNSHTPSEHSFLLFTVIWSILVVIYLALIPRFATRFFHTLVALGLLVVTTIFWFAGSIALAVVTPGWGCGTLDCGVAIAAVVFGFFIWAIFVGLTVVDTLTFMRSRGHTAHADTTTTNAKPYPGV
ncbi:hypothetical protein B0I35DRAFT_406159 [Stachybotrys elegans]|uniref:MARVEL domain-containing protein n=1 Tax=Stachybotrys elegans TaxID=80388 RepID=A0A8K0SVW0_9HYPO|nr:hypothetical protein B0I35DRAFT_406159 [Stachybotrys elegans]